MRRPLLWAGTVILLNESDQKRLDELIRWCNMRVRDANTTTNNEVNKFIAEWQKLREPPK